MAGQSERVAPVDQFTGIFAGASARIGAASRFERPPSRRMQGDRCHVRAEHADGRHERRRQQNLEFPRRLGARSSTVLVISAGLVDRVPSLSPRKIDLGFSAARAWASAGSNSQQAGRSRRSGVRRGGSRRPWRLRSTEAPRDGRISRSRVRSVLSGPVPCHSARKRPRRPALQRRPSRI